MASDHGQNKQQTDGLFRRTKLSASPEQRKAIYESVLDSSHMDIEYVALLVLAGLIALFGLLENSAAVIIGAMLISPLMNPILSAALALLLGDGNLGKRSATVLALSIAVVVGITWLVAYLTPLKEATPEILARTSPNLLDLFIAVLSGLAGTLALRGGSVALTILPGVAIAVAVVPPLAVVGYGLSTHQGSIAGGAFLLFVTNLVSIIISAAAVFRVMDFQPQRQAEQGRWKLKYRLGISAIVLLLLAIPLFLTLRKAAIEVTTNSELRRELQADFRENDASVSDLSFTSAPNGLMIRATLRTARYVETNAIRAVEDSLRKKFGSQTKLLIDQILVTQGGAPTKPAVQPQNPISGGVVKPVGANAPFDFKQSSLKNLEFVRTELEGVLAGTAIQSEASPEIVLTSAPPLTVRLQLSSSAPINVQTISVLGSQLGFKLGLPVQLHGEVAMRGASYQLAIAPAKPGLGLTPKDRAAANQLIRIAEQSSLRLQANYASEQNAKDRKIPRSVSELRDLFLRSRLKSSQWTVEEAPPGESAAKSATETPAAPIGTAGKNHEANPPGHFVCEVKAFQDF